MEYAVEMGSGTMMCISSFIKTGSVIQNLRGGGTQTHGHTDSMETAKTTLFFKKEAFLCTQTQI
jgi:hypothetical protein